MFQQQFTQANLNGNFNDFISFYQTIDMLIVDDVQEWMTATKTQNAFFHIFNHLSVNGKRIILVSDRAPVELEGMNKRLLSRFKSGMMAEMEQPNVQLCEDILYNKMARDGMKIPGDVVKFIAQTANNSIRELEGIINSLMAYSIMCNCNIDMKLAARVVGRAVKIDNMPLTVDDIIDIVCRQYEVTPNAVKGASRKRELVIPRQVIIYLADKYTNLPAARIGKLVGGRDHSTVLHSINKVRDMIEDNMEFAAQLAKVEERLKVKKS
jgi:chromosomal replication initiator protein